MRPIFLEEFSEVSEYVSVDFISGVRLINKFVLQEGVSSCLHSSGARRKDVFTPWLETVRKGEATSIRG